MLTLLSYNILRSNLVVTSSKRRKKAITKISALVGRLSCFY